MTWSHGNGSGLSCLTTGFYSLCPKTPIHSVLMYRNFRRIRWYPDQGGLGRFKRYVKSHSGTAIVSWWCTLSDHICRNISRLFSRVWIAYCNRSSWRHLPSQFYWEDVVSRRYSYRQHKQENNSWITGLQRCSFWEDHWGCTCTDFAQSHPWAMLTALGRTWYPANPSRRRIGYWCNSWDHNSGAFWKETHWWTSWITF